MNFKRSAALTKIDGSTTNTIYKRDIDKGYAWIIMAVTFFNNYICGIIFASFAVLYYDFMQAFDCSVGALGWIISINCVCMFTSGKTKVELYL